MTKTLSITKAREDFTKIVDRANRLLDEYVITVNGSPAAVVISAAEYDSWKETNDIESDLGLVRAIKHGEKELDNGEGRNWEDVKKQLKINV